VCGICGAFGLEGPLDPAIRAALPGMAAAIAHRGPDSDGFHAEERVALGHRRLAIIDRAGGEQPMANEDGSVWIVFNGEVYNHADLRRELAARGHVFRTRSDTEAIIHAFEEWGERCVERLEGMFAFAIWDRRRRALFLARDRLGKKPLFYAVLGGALHFASEIKSFYASPAWDPAPDLSGLEGYLALGYFLAPGTVYRHVRKLEAGHWLSARDGRIEVRRYWDVERFDDDPRGGRALRDELEAALRKAVHERLESEVPLGAFLSGGIDSGLVVSFMAEALGHEVVTTSVGFGGDAHNELAPAGLTARRYGTRHFPETIEPRLEDVLDRIVGAFDEPFADSSVIPTFYVSQIARRHVTVALSGDGGDEAFGGYDFRYVPHALECRARALVPGRAGRRAARWLGAHWPRGRRVPHPLRLATIFENLGRDAAGAYYADLCFLKPREARALLGLNGANGAAHVEGPAYEAVAGAYRRCPSPSPLQRAQYADLKVYLANDVLVKVDRMSMQHGLEVRCPFLDRRVVELAFRIPTERKMPRLAPKHLLRALARTRLPHELRQLPKRGFTAPVGRWLAGPYAGAFEADVLGPGAHVPGLLDERRVRALFEAHRAGRADNAYALWAVWMLERWARGTKGAAAARRPA
jgi:asparagine synthase (glutamine-hydrolysing)